MAITMFSALVGDLILLPSLLLHAELVTLWDLIRLKLGKDPGFGIPLFNGLSRTQVHYIIMAGTLKKIEAGKVLFHKGDPSDSMWYIILFGLPHILASSVTLIDRDYIQHYQTQISTGLILVFVVALCLTFVISPILALAIFAILTVLHVIGQQTGITRMLTRSSKQCRVTMV